MVRMLKGFTVAGALGAVAFLGACGKGNSNAADTMAAAGSDTATVASGTTTGAANGTMGNTAASTPMTDAQIFTALTEANQSEIDAGKLAETKATNAGVKAFARQMVTDHTQLLKQGNDLAGRLKVTPGAVPNDSLGAHAKAEMQQLQSAPRGAAFDSTYVNAQVQDHQQVLAMLRSLDGKAQAAQLNDMIRAAEPKVQQHLTRAQALQAQVK